MNHTQAILYVPSDTPEAMSLATSRVGGVPIIVRGVMTLAETGIENITLLIAGAQRQKIECFLGRYKDEHLPCISFIEYDEPYRVSPDIIQKIADGMGGRCLLINANLLFENELVALIKSEHLEDGGVVFCAEGAHSLPVMDVTPKAWRELLPFTAEKPRSIESCIRKIAEVSDKKVANKPAFINTFLVRNHRDRAVAEKSLTEAIRHSTMGPVAKYFNKRISLPISLVLAKLWVTPNAITAFNVVIGLFSGVFVADGNNYGIILFGAALFQTASIIDGCDGEVAKLTFRASKFGQYVDSLSDNLSLLSFLIGLIAGYWRHTHSPVAFLVGAVLVVSTAITFFWMILYLKRNTQSASLVTFDKEYLQKLSGYPKWLLTLIKYGKYTLKKDVFSFMFFLFALAGVLYWWLFLAAFGTTVAAVILTYLNVKGLFAAKEAA